MAAQDMPPPGGFASIPIERTFPKPLLRQSIFSIGIILVSFNGLFYLKEWKKRYRIIRIEETEHYLATLPFLYAEQERKYLKRLKKLREDEEFVMKGVPGWSAGTLFGEKVFKTVPDNKLQGPSAEEFTVGWSRRDWNLKTVIPDWWR